MPRLDANIDLLFTEVPFADRFQASRDAGIEAVEILSPYPHGAEALTAAARAADTGIVLINSRMPDPASGDIGYAARPDRVEAFQALAIEAVEMAAAIGAPRIHMVAGRGDAESDAARRCFVDNLRMAADLAARSGIALMLEPLNTVDRPGYYLTTNRQALDLIDRIGRENVRLQFDAYHTQIMTGDLTRALRDCRDHIGHIQIANPPDRHEPGAGEIDFVWFLNAVDRLGYDGPVGLEYAPSTTTDASLDWFRRNGFLG